MIEVKNNFTFFERAIYFIIEFRIFKLKYISKEDFKKNVNNENQ